MCNACQEKGRDVCQWVDVDVVEGRLVLFATCPSGMGQWVCKATRVAIGVFDGGLTGAWTDSGR